MTERDLNWAKEVLKRFLDDKPVEVEELRFALKYVSMELEYADFENRAA